MIENVSSNREGEAPAKPHPANDEHFLRDALTGNGCRSQAIFKSQVLRRMRLSGSFALPECAEATLTTRSENWTRRQWVTCCLIAWAWAGASAAAQDVPKREFAIVIHGGAGKGPATGETAKAREEALRKGLTKGRDMLASGASSLDAVEAVLRILEDDPSINAGKGAVMNLQGGHELDATIMNGKTRACGSVGGVTTVKNPISLARKVMEKSPHVLLVTDGAEKFADQFQPADGIERVPNSYFTTEERRAEWKRLLEKSGEPPRPMGTCGCACLDKAGNLAAGTTTGGTANKLHGRLGDSPIVGAGTYADNRTCAVSCTGVGEDFIRYAVSYDINARMRYAGQSLQEASHAVLNVPDQLVRGGLVSLDAKGNIAMEFNTGGMSRAAADSAGRWEIHVAD